MPLHLASADSSLDQWTELVVNMIHATSEVACPAVSRQGGSYIDVFVVATPPLEMGNARRLVRVSVPVYDQGDIDCGLHYDLARNLVTGLGFKAAGDPIDECDDPALARVLGTRTTAILVSMSPEVGTGVAGWAAVPMTVSVRGELHGLVVVVDLAARGELEVALPDSGALTVGQRERLVRAAIAAATEAGYDDANVLNAGVGVLLPEVD